MNKSPTMRIIISWIMAFLLADLAIGAESLTPICNGLKMWGSCGIYEPTEIKSAEAAIESPVDLNVRTFKMLQNEKVEFIPLNLAVFPNLKTVIITSCAISSVNENHFKSLVNVTDIDLQRNNIDTIAPDAFKDQINLENLFLGENKIRTLDPQVFQSLIKLEFLVLRDNGLEELHPNIFESLINLKTLWMSRNKIRSLDGNVFRDLAKLDTVNLFSNSLSELPENLFENNFKLTSIELNSNDIKFIPANTFDHQEALRYVGLMGNNCLDESYSSDEISTMKRDIIEHCSRA